MGNDSRHRLGVLVYGNIELCAGLYMLPVVDCYGPFDGLRTAPPPIAKQQHWLGDQSRGEQATYNPVYISN